MKVVLDTNIFISGIHWTGNSEKILRAWFDEEFELISSTPIVQELVKILKSFKKPMEEKDIQWWEDLIIEKSTIVVPTKQINVVSDPDDNKFIEAAVEGKANYIVSQDKHLLIIKEYEGIKIIHPDEFMKLI